MKLRMMASVLMVGAAMLLAACGSGGSGGGGTSPVAAPSAGTFIDSPVQGLHYSTLPSNLSGFTDVNGQYNYRTGDTVIFDIGGRPIGGPVDASPVVTALTVFGAASISDPQVVNLSQLLLGIGTVNGQGVIVLPQTIPSTLPSPLNFADPSFDTMLQNVGITLASEPTAAAHLQSSFSTVAVTMAGAGSGSVASIPVGISCSTNSGTSSGTCSAVLSNNFSVTLTPTGSGFAGWIGGTGSAAACSGTGACTFTLIAASNITATFNVPPPSTLSISNAGTGTGTVTCSANGGAFVACDSQYADGTLVVIKATASSDSTFTGWTSGSGNAIGCNNMTVNCSITLNTNTTVTANFALNAVTQFSVTSATASANSGGGTVQCSANTIVGPCGSYPAGTAVSVIANPDGASLFSGWSNGNGSGLTANCNSATGPCTFTLTGNTTITANFNKPTLQVNVAGTGSVSSSPTGINSCAVSCVHAFDKGTQVTLTPTGTGFSGWTGGCSGTGSCQFTLNANTTVQATFGTVSSAATFKFVAAPGRELLAINPALPGTPIPVKVNGANVTIGNPPTAAGTTLDVFSGASLIDTASYNSATKTYTNLQHNTILFTSGGKLYKASTLVGNGVPGSAPGNEPQQVSNVIDAVSCGVGSVYDVVNPNQAVGFVSAGLDGTCFTSDDRPVVMHLNDSSQTAPVLLPVGASSLGETVYDATTGLALHTLYTNTNGDLLSLDNSLTLIPIINGTGIGPVNVVAQQSDKVFVANFTNLYIYIPSTHTLNLTPVVTADPNTGFINVGVGDRADLSNIFLVQTDGAVYKVPLSTTSPITAKHFVAPANTVAYAARLTTNKIAIVTGLNPSDTFGSFSPCYTSNPRTCNNGILAVDKVTGVAATIEAAASEKAIFLNQSFNNYVLYTRSDPATAGISDGALLRIEDASTPAVLVGKNGGWGGQVQTNSASWVALNSPTVIAVFSQFTNVGPPATGTVSSISLPTASPVLLGTVSASPAVTNMPFFFESSESTMIGYALLQASPTNHQPYFLNAASANSLAPITTPGAAAKWEEVRD